MIPFRWPIEKHGLPAAARSELNKQLEENLVTKN